MSLDASENSERPWLELSGGASRLQGRLCSIPSLRYRLVFAQLVDRAFERERFDAVAIELPRDFDDPELLDAALALTWGIGMIGVNFSCRGWVILPLSPADAFTAAIRQARTRRVPLHFVDTGWFAAAEFISPPSRSLDDYRVVTEGLSALVQHLNQPEVIAADRELLQRNRAFVIASELRRLLRGGRRVLYLGTPGVYARVSALLQTRLLPVGAPTQREELPVERAIILAEPLDLWERGLLDDFPNVVWQYEYARVTEGASGFDKRNATNHVVEKALAEALRKGLGPSMRQWTTFRSYLATRTAARARLVPTLHGLLASAARECFSPPVAEKVIETALHYPLPRAAAELLVWIRRFRIAISRICDLDSRMPLFFIGGPEGHAADADRAERRSLRSEIERAQWESLGHEGRGSIAGSAMHLGGWWLYRPEKRLRMKQAARARHAAIRFIATCRTVASSGSLGAGIDWKATIRARAVSPRRIFIRDDRSSRALQDDLARSTTPVCFLFDKTLRDGYFTATDSDSPASYNRFFGVSTLPPRPPDFIYSRADHVRGEIYLASGAIRVKQLLGCVEIDSSSPYPWKTYEAVSHLPKRRQCRIPFDADPELTRFHGNDKIVAGAIKYSGLVTVVVNAPGMRTSELVRRYAARRRVRLIELPSRLCQRAWPHLQLCHAYTDALRKSPGKREILRRYITALPGLSEQELSDIQ